MDSARLHRVHSHRVLHHLTPVKNGGSCRQHPGTAPRPNSVRSTLLAHYVQCPAGVEEFPERITRRPLPAFGVAVAWTVWTTWTLWRARNRTQDLFLRMGGTRRSRGLPCAVDRPDHKQEVRRSFRSPRPPKEVGNTGSAPQRHAELLHELGRLIGLLQEARNPLPAEPVRGCALRVAA